MVTFMEANIPQVASPMNPFNFDLVAKGAKKIQKPQGTSKQVRDTPVLSPSSHKLGKVTWIVRNPDDEDLN